jgi:hypothetical protein
VLGGGDDPLRGACRDLRRARVEALERRLRIDADNATVRGATDSDATAVP